MNRVDIFKMAFKNLFRRKLRTFLTTLGIIIGTISIVVTISLGMAMKKSFEDQMKNMGSMNIITVNPGYDQRKMVMARRNDEEPTITQEQLEKIIKVKGVDAVTPIREERIKLVSGKYIASVQVKAVWPEFVKELGANVEKGRLLQKGDTSSMVLGSDIPYQFRDKNAKEDKMANQYRMMDREGKRPDPKVDVMKDKISLTFDMDYGVKRRNVNGSSKPKKKKVRPQDITCVGLLKQGNWQTRRAVYISMDYLEKIKGSYLRKVETSEERKERLKKERKGKGYQEVLVKVSDVKKIKGITEEIRGLGCDAWSDMQWIEQAEKEMNVIQMILGGIGAISLLVAAIGITNTMVMAIYERRKEIGVMKVIGSSIGDIKKLFLIESSLIGLLGGIFGSTASILLSKLINHIGRTTVLKNAPPEQMLSYIPLWLMGAALGFTALIGLLSGYLPARKAMKLSALEAIKTE
ncbi:ABC transporter permease [Clostridium aestuarii]|uniref:ABC transporter permease n=1 Tax=Clostridium aestuarii TaxID=338193 RepID=A0ABT4D0T9_9CLOT|nr:ABC transporter permease [Clostridium aestuarii]MCY6484860.1 ABC transporter permease [Clostridium aestuarii]